MMKPNAPDFSNRVVLIVDDDEHTRTLLKDLCETSGFKTLVAEDGVEAMDHISRTRPDLMLLDLMMPRRDGFSVLKAVRETTELAELPVIVLTAMGDMDGKIRGMELGADDYITKPFKLIELQTRINSALTVREYRRRLLDAEDELAQFRAVDPVTGAGTYSQLKASLDSELARSRRYGRPAACLMFGFDDYQGLRYQLGRDACDGYLAKVVNEAKSAMRGADRLFRIDTDEFVALLPETDLPGARIVAERMLTLLQAIPIEGPHGRLRVVTRFGGAVFPSDRVRSSEDLLREANKSFRALQASEAPKFLFDA
ncbi:MAG: response regulator [Myxococcaceae bacterium]|jgi:diguanylate cyclase (GGDEF)-like protein|nr:response regulator [Myxococcaceae bacterium]